MEVRTPAVSGTFYPDDEKELKSLIHDCFIHPIGPGKIPTTDSNQKIYGVICPHAGFVYSGPVACHSFYAISSSTSNLAIMVGPNHYGIGQNVASMIVVKRFGFDIQEWHLDKNNKCKFCGNQIPITGSLAKGYKQERFQFVV